MHAIMHVLYAIKIVKFCRLQLCRLQSHKNNTQYQFSFVETPRRKFIVAVKKLRTCFQETKLTLFSPCKHIQNT